MESELLSIGRMARATGLTVSALRFYDGAGILVPALVDPATGYRWYARRQVRPGRLVARLRRVGMPLVDIAEVLRQWPESARVRPLLDAHLRRLEAGLADACRELSRLESQLDEENTMADAISSSTRLTVPGADLAEALAAVRFAMCADPNFPMLCGMLFEVETPGGQPVLRLVATDRYRLAVAALPVPELTGDPASAIVPARLVDDVRAALERSSVSSPVKISLGTAGITVAVGDNQLSAPPVDHDFPDYRGLLPERLADVSGRRVTVDAVALRGSLAGGDTLRIRREYDDAVCDVAVLAVDQGGVMTVGAEHGPDAVGVNREFLLEALNAAGSDQLVLELDGPVRPLAIRVPHDDRRFSILMPTVLPGAASAG